MASYDSTTKVTLANRAKATFTKSPPRVGIPLPSYVKTASGTGGGNGVASEEFPTVYGFL